MLRIGDCGILLAVTFFKSPSSPKVHSMTTSRFRVHGLDCADEVAVLREAVGKLPGVTDLSFDILRGLMIVDHEMAAVSCERIEETVARTGMRAEVIDESSPSSSPDIGAGRTWKTFVTVGSGVADERPNLFRSTGRQGCLAVPQRDQDIRSDRNAHRHGRLECARRRHIGRVEERRSTQLATLRSTTKSKPPSLVGKTSTKTNS